MEEKTCAEICRDLLALLKNFQRIYFETDKDSHYYSAQEEEKQQEEQQAMEKKMEKKVPTILEENQQVEQEKRNIKLQEYAFEDGLPIQQLDSDVIPMDEQKKKGGWKTRKANLAKLKKKIWIKRLFYQWGNESNFSRSRGNTLVRGVGVGGGGGRGVGGGRGATKLEERKRKRK